MISSLRRGGRIAILVGDVKRKGRLYSLQKDMDWYGAPEQVVIKTQHNCRSDKVNYSGKFIPIVHEYLLIFKRDDCYIVPCTVVRQVGIDLRQRPMQTWRDVVKDALEFLGGKAELGRLYNELNGHAKTESDQNWQAKIRLTLQRYTKDFQRVSEGCWALAG